MNYLIICPPQGRALMLLIMKNNLKLINDLFLYYTRKCILVLNDTVCSL